MKIRYAISAAAVVFLLHATLYIADPNHRKTAACLVEKNIHVADDNMLSSLNVTAFAQDTNRLVWIGTSAGINIYNGNGYLQFFHDAKDSTALPDDYINVLHRDARGRMWVGTQNGLARYEGGCRFKRFRLPVTDNNITAIADDPTHEDRVVVANRKDNFTIASSGYIKKVDIAMPKTVQTVVSADSSLLAKPRDLVSTTFTDADNNQWIGFRNAGYQVLSPNVTGYILANCNSLARATHNNDIVSLASTGGTIIAGTTRRLYVYDSLSGRVSDTFYRELFGMSPTQDGGELNNVVPLDGHRAWIVGNKQIVSCVIRGGCMAIGARVFGNSGSPGLLGCGTRVAGCLYVCTSDGYVLRCRYGVETADTIAHAGRWLDEETQLAPLPGGRLLLFMKQMHLAELNVTNGKLSPLHDLKGIDGAENINPAFVRTDSRGNVWLGTKRSGLYKLNFRHRRVERMNFPDDVHIQALVEDGRGQIWITTLKDVVCYQPQTGAVLKSSIVSASQNNWNRQYFDNSICLTPKGDVVLGSSEGCIFMPSAVGGTAESSRYLCIYGFEVKTTGGQSLVYKGGISDGMKLTLAHDEKALTLSFFYPNYSSSASLMYQYMLEGYDRDWREPTYSHKAYFANIQPGSYRFRLRLLASAGQPPVAERTVEIKVKAAPWNCAAAWMLYAVCAALLIYYVNTLYLNLRKNKLQLQHEHNERERQKHANEMNMSFFANISHEFRNPITIIAGPLIALSADKSLPQSVQRSLQRVCLSVNRMLRLIDQMLDFNQLETDALRLKVARVDAANELRNIVASFEEAARVRSIGLTLDVADADYSAWIDTDKLEKIVSNLFTNALKHTPDKGLIAFSACTEQAASGCRVFRVRLFNTGAQISDARLNDIFKRYFQLADANASHKYGWGTGLGLYYVKRLVGLHHGDISVCNVGDRAGDRDSGVEFTFTLPMDEAAYRNAEHVAEPPRIMQIPAIVAPADAEKEQENGKAKILVVDDDVDVAQYIRSIFAGTYVVENRYTAESALASMAEIRPDIVLSDIIMGEMSGFDFCRKLKSDLMYSHIPVVLITAKSDIDEQISGLQLGAVAYVTKPFDPAYLFALVGSQLKNTRLLRQKLGLSTSVEDVAASMSEQDNKFMAELYSVMERHASELDLSVASVSHDMLISQSKFNYKVKELTGDTPGVFFRKYKLNKAARLLSEGKYNISEVAVMTGFSTAAHFSVAFKKQFGVVPSEYSV